jgi:hypothetical protein
MNSAAASSSGDGVKRRFIASDARNERLLRKESAVMLFNAFCVATGNGGGPAAVRTGRKAAALSRQLPATMSQAVRLNGDEGICGFALRREQCRG